MQIIDTTPLHVLSFGVQTTLSDLDKFAITVPKQLYAEAARLGLLVTGPLYWRYLGADGKMDTVFTLQIGLPLERSGSPADNGTFTFVEWPPLRCLTQQYAGPWDGLHEAYGKGIQWLLHEGFTIGAEAREAYLNVDLTHPSNNRTEVQIGIV